MITWIGLLAKLTESVLTKLAGRRIELSLDKRHRAAKGLLRFYDTLQQARDLVEELVDVFGAACSRRKPVLFSKDLVPFENAIVRVNEDFQRHFDEMAAAISILSPELGSALHTVRGFKTSTTTAFGALLKKARFELEYDGLHPFRKVAFTTFRNEVLELDIEALAEASSIPISDDPPFGPPESNELARALATLLVEDEFTADDFEKVAYLRDRLRNQKVVLEVAVELLRKFIAANFTVADLLYARRRWE
jgi:hypothetical protein